MKIFNNPIVNSLILILCIFFYSCDKVVSTSPPDPPVPTGFIYIESNPSGASIYLNGKITGKVTPDSLSWLKEDTYKVTLKLNLFRDTSVYLKAVEGQRNKILVDYLSNPMMYGSITCTSDPVNASIYLNDKFTGKHTPYTFTNLVPGNYMVKLQAYGCRDDSVLVTLRSNSNALASKVLKDTTIWMDYNAYNSPLPSNYLTCIEIINNNQKWIGTQDKGVVYFDGTTWKTFDPSNSPMPSKYVTCMGTELMSVIVKGIWIGTNNGLVYYNGSVWKVYKTDNSILPDNYITALNVDGNGNVWVGTMKGLLSLKTDYSRNNYTWTLYNTANSKLPSNWISQLAVNYLGKVWIGTASSGLAFFDGNNFTVYTKENSQLPGNSVTAISTELSQVGTVWVAFAKVTSGVNDPGGLVAYDNGKWTSGISGLPSLDIKAIVLNNNSHWVCTSRGLVQYSSPNAFSIIDRNNSKLPSEDIRDIVFDLKGCMWIATSNAGLVYYKLIK